MKVGTNRTETCKVFPMPDFPVPIWFRFWFTLRLREWLRGVRARNNLLCDNTKQSTVATVHFEWDRNKAPAYTYIRYWWYLKH